MAVDRRTPDFLAQLVGMRPEQLDRFLAAEADLVEIALAIDQDLEADELAQFGRLAECVEAYLKICKEIGRRHTIWKGPRAKADFGLITAKRGVVLLREGITIGDQGQE